MSSEGPMSWSCATGPSAARSRGASTIATAATATTPLAVAMNLRRSVVMPSSLSCDKLMVGALRHVVPRAHQRLEPCEGRVHLPGHGRLFGFLLHNLGGELLEIAQHRHWELKDVDLPFEFALEPFERDRVLRMEGCEAIDLHR